MYETRSLIGPATGHTRVSWLPAAILGFAMMAAVQTGTPHITGNDGYYHVKMAALLPELGFTKSFPWLRWTILNEQFVSHHYGFHVLLLPFVYAAEASGHQPAFGGKIAACVALGVTFAIFHVLVRGRGAPFPLLWVLFLAVLPWHFWLRMTYVRAPMAALPLLLLAVHWIIRGRVWAMLILAFVFTQVYGGAILFPLVPGSFFLAALITREQPLRAAWQLAASIAGIILGMVISPYFPANLSFFITQLFETGLGAARDVGGEWKPYETWALLLQAAPLAAIWVACLTLRLRTAVPASRAELGIFFVNLAFFVLTLKSRRFVEYWPVFALLSAGEFAAVAWRARPREHSIRIKPAVGIVGVVAVVALGAWNLWMVWADQRPSHDVVAIREAMEFLRENSPPRSLVFTDDWDIFPICFYFNHHNTYAVGLDPEFTRTRYPALWERYRRITRAELPAKLPKDLRSESEDPAIKYEDIGTIFEANYVLVADDHNKLYRALIDRPDAFELIYPEKTAHQPPIAIFRTLPNLGRHDGGDVGS